MESDEGIDTNELNTVLSKSNIKSSADITEKFNELDTNKNGKLEEAEVSLTNEAGEIIKQIIMKIIMDIKMEIITGWMDGLMS